MHKLQRDGGTPTGGGFVQEQQPRRRDELCGYRHAPSLPARQPPHVRVPNEAEGHLHARAMADVSPSASMKDRTGCVTYWLQPDSRSLGSKTGSCSKQGRRRLCTGYGSEVGMQWRSRGAMQESKPDATAFARKASRVDRLALC